MESAKAKMKIFLGFFKVIEVKLGVVTINMSGGVHVSIHLVGLPVTIQPGDTIPLFTEISYNPEPLDALLVGSPKQ